MLCLSEIAWPPDYSLTQEILWQVSGLEMSVAERNLALPGWVQDPTGSEHNYLVASSKSINIFSIITNLFYSPPPWAEAVTHLRNLGSKCRKLEC